MYVDERCIGSSKCGRVLPPETKITKDAAAQFLMSLGHVSRPASFEIIGTS